MEDITKAEITFWSLLVVIGMMIIFWFGIKVIDHRVELKQCHDTMQGFSKLEKREACKR